MSGKEFRQLCGTVLIMEAVVIGLAIPVAIALEHVRHGIAGGVGGGLALCALLLGGLVGRPGQAWALWAGTALQVLVIAAGVVVPAMYILGAIFAALWITGIRLARRLQSPPAPAPPKHLPPPPAPTPPAPNPAPCTPQHLTSPPHAPAPGPAPCTPRYLAPRTPPALRALVRCSLRHHCELGSHQPRHTAMIGRISGSILACGSVKGPIAPTSLPDAQILPGNGRHAGTGAT